MPCCDMSCCELVREWPWLAGDENKEKAEDVFVVAGVTWMVPVEGVVGEVRATT